MDIQFWDGKRAPGVSDTVDLDQFQSVAEVFEKSLAEHGDRVAFTNMGQGLSYRELDQLSDHFLSWIQNHTDLKPGDRIAVQMPNTLQYPIAVLGIFKAGLVLVNTNPLYTAREMIHQFNDSGAKALLFMDTFGDLVESVLPETGIETAIVTSLGDMLPTGKRLLITAVTRYVKKVIPKFSVKATPFRKVISQGKQAKGKPQPLTQPEDVVTLQYTGGTTGVAKGAELTNRNLVSNMLQIDTISQQTNDQGEALKGSDDIVIAPLPLYHIYAFTVNMLYGMYGGGETVLITNPRDPDTFIGAMKGKAFTSFTGLNTLFVSLMAHPGFKELDFSRLKMTGFWRYGLKPRNRRALGISDWLQNW